MYERLSKGSFYGDTLRRYETNGLTLVESVFHPQTKLEHHYHQNPYFCLTLRGSYEESYSNRKRACVPATLVYHPAEEIHAQQFLDQGVRLFRLELHTSWVDRIQPHSSVFQCGADFTGGRLVTLLNKLYGECREPDSVSPLAIEGLALEVVAGMVREQTPSKAPAWLKFAREFLYEHFAEPLNPSAISSLLNVHPVHLSRTFRRFEGCSMGEYVRQRRVEVAASRLSSSDDTIADIGTQVGFSDQSHFSRHFKRFTGFAPGRYRTIFKSR